MDRSRRRPPSDGVQTTRGGPALSRTVQRPGWAPPTSVALAVVLVVIDLLTHMSGFEGTAHGSAAGSRRPPVARAVGHRSAHRAGDRAPGIGRSASGTVVTDPLGRPPPRPRSPLDVGNPGVVGPRGDHHRGLHRTRRSRRRVGLGRGPGGRRRPERPVAHDHHHHRTPGPGQRATATDPAGHAHRCTTDDPRRTVDRRRAGRRDGLLVGRSDLALSLQVPGGQGSRTGASGTAVSATSTGGTCYVDLTADAPPGPVTYMLVLNYQG